MINYEKINHFVQRLESICQPYTIKFVRTKDHPHWQSMPFTHILCSLLRFYMVVTAGSRIVFQKLHHLSSASPLNVSAVRIAWDATVVSLRPDPTAPTTQPFVLGSKLRTSGDSALKSGLARWIPEWSSWQGLDYGVPKPAGKWRT